MQSQNDRNAILSLLLISRVKQVLKIIEIRQIQEYRYRISNNGSNGAFI